MRDFLATLDAQLAAVAVPAAAPQRPTRLRVPRLPGLLALVAASGATLAVTGTSAADLPILSTDTTDATTIAAQVPAAAGAGVDFAAAHVFGTPGGPGYVLTNPADQTLCVVAPDAGTPGEFGSVCNGPISTIEQEGLLLQSIGDTARDPEATALSVFLLPRSATDVRLDTAGSSRKPPIESGVVVVTLPAPGTLRWRDDRGAHELELAGPFVSTGMQFTCDDGRTASGPLPPADLDPSKVGAELRASRRKACAR